MSQKKQDIGPQDALVAAIAAQGAPPDNTIQRQLLSLLLEDFAERKQEKDQQKAMIKRANEQNVANVRAAQKIKDQEQAACSHKKPNGQPNIGGQRDHSDNFHFLCLACNKQWINDLPPDLRIPADLVGGPTAG